MKNFHIIRSKGAIILGFVLTILSIIAILVIAFVGINRIRDINTSTSNIENTINNISELKADFNRIRAVSLELMGEKDPTKFTNTMNDIKNKQIEIEEVLLTLKNSLDVYPEVQKKFITIESIAHTYFNENEKYENYLKEGDLDYAYLLLKSSLNNYYENIRNQIIATENELIIVKKDFTSTYKSISSRIANNSLFFGILMILIITAIAIALLKMLSNITTEIKSGIDILATTSEDILSTITKMSTSASETAASVTETTATIEEVRQTASIANDRAKSLLESTNRVKRSADQGQNSMDMVINGMEQIDIQMKKISSTVIKLSEQNRRVGQITSSVADIADQSNLLAVNAAIEAAKAGEHGRGFTVVAQEIRNLSDQSKRATLQVKEILNEIEKYVDETVGVTEESKKTVEAGKELAIQSGEVINILAGNIEETANAAMQISSSNHQQMAGMDQIVPAMENIKKASELNVSGIRQTQHATSEVNKLGQSLKRILLKFNL